jgi:hypothetical protein
MKLTAVLSLTDNYTDTLKQAIKKTQEFRDETEKTKKALEETFGQKYEISMNTTEAATDLKKVQKSLKDMDHTNLFVSLQLKEPKGSDWKEKLVKAGAKVAMGILSAFMKVVKLMFQPLKLLSHTAQLVTASIKGAAAMERNVLSVEHLIAANNKGLPAEAVKKRAADYMKTYRSSPELASFDSEEVQKAGTRAVGIAMGDTSEASNLLRLAGDMAAVTPGKSLEDALDALAELKKGEADAMEDFGFQTTESKIKAAGKNMGKVTSRNGVALSDMFAGGGKKAGESAEGLWTSITNALKDGIGDMGRKTLDALKPELKNWAAFLRSDGFQKMLTAGSELLSGLAQGVAQRSEQLRGWLERTFFNNEEFGKLDLKDKITIVLDKIKTGFNDWFSKEGKDMITSIGAEGSVFMAAIASTFSSIGFKITLGLADGLTRGMETIIKDHPVLSALAYGVAGAGIGAILGPGGAALGAAAGAGASLLESLVLNMLDWGSSKSSKSVKQNTSVAPGTGPMSTPASAQKPPSAPSVIYNPKSIQMPYLQPAPTPGPPPALPLYYNHAIGLPRVPYDNYPAMLHQNERVLTAQEARNMDRSGSPVVINLTAGKTTDPDIGRLMAALKQAVEAAGFNMAPGGATA